MVSARSLRRRTADGGAAPPLSSESTARAVASQLKRAARSSPAARSRARSPRRQQPGQRRRERLAPSALRAGGAAARLRQRGRRGATTGVPARHRLQHGQPEALVERGQREGGRAGVEAGQQGVVDVAEQAQGVEPVLARELGPVAARDDDVHPVAGQRARGGHERREVLARGVGGDARARTGGRGRARAAPARGPRRARSARPTPPGTTVRASTPSSSPNSARENSDTVMTPARAAREAGSTRRCHAA